MPLLHPAPSMSFDLFLSSRGLNLPVALIREFSRCANGNGFGDQRDPDVARKILFALASLGKEIPGPIS